MKSFKKIWNIFTNLLLAVIVVVAVLLGGGRLVGIKVFAVLSGSMEPTYHTGALIWVKGVDYKELKPGDPITYMLDEETVVTHRITEVVPDENDPEVIRYRTKGDANDVEDGTLVHYKNVIGTPIFTIPKLGYVIDFVQRPPGLYLGIAGVAALLFIIIVPDFWMADDEEEEQKEKKSRKKKKNVADSQTEPENMKGEEEKPQGKNDK